MMARIRTLLHQLISVADEPADDDDARLRKRVLVIAGYILVIGPLQLQQVFRPWTEPVAAPHRLRHPGLRDLPRRRAFLER